MSDYEPDYVYMIPLDYKRREVFYENITHVPARIRGAFLIDEESIDQIDFEIRGPNGDVKYRNTTNACIFEFNSTDVGIYSIILHNVYVNSEVKVTLTMNTGQNTVLKKEDLSFSEQKLDNLLSFINKLNLEMKMSRGISSERYRKINHANKYFYTFSVAESLILIGISVWQFYYMRQLFEVKGSF